MNDAARLWAVVPAAGRGTRMGSELPKQYLAIAGRTILEHTLEALLAEPRIAAAVLVLAPDDAQGTALAAIYGERVRTALGGAERCHSVLNGLDALPARDHDWALVHDAARPCLRLADLSHLIDELLDDPCGGILGVPVKDTLKRCGSDGRIAQTVDRNQLWQALTPQMFRVGALRAALRTALMAGRMVTDEAQAMELAGHLPRMIEGHADNLKITRPEDLAFAELSLRARPIAKGTPTCA